MTTLNHMVWEKQGNVMSSGRLGILLPYILESNPHPDLIHTSFCRFLKRKKKLVRGSNPHLSFNRPFPTRQTDSVMSDDGGSDEL